MNLAIVPDLQAPVIDQTKIFSISTATDGSNNQGLEKMNLVHCAYSTYMCLSKSSTVIGISHTIDMGNDQKRYCMGKLCISGS